MKKKELEKIIKEKDEYFSGWQREKADFLNYKKQEFERLKETLNIAKESLFKELIPVLDNFNLAQKAIPEEETEKNSIKGLLLIKKQLEDSLKSLGLEEIETIGKQFDPKMHEAVEEVEGAEPGVIVEEVQKGYSFQDKIIRVAKVKIGRYHS
ncbi:MAG TPA: nucleotide exchange factor GrpE [Candidatus Pacearchaeota archaeon]|nr:nucleotide exchange factor GrpE [Candidatus Pacearchaeota archaeon]